jgi:hypothetical protein
MSPKPGDSPVTPARRDDELADIARRLAGNWPEADVKGVVAAAYQRIAQGARVTLYLPVLTEHLARTWLSEQRQQVAAGQEAGADDDGRK